MQFSPFAQDRKNRFERFTSQRNYCQWGTRDRDSRQCGDKQLIITLPALFIVIGSPIAGLIVDRFGRKPLLLITAILDGFAGSSGLFLDNLPAILVGRLLSNPIEAILPSQIWVLKAITYRYIVTGTIWGIFSF